MGRSSAGVFIDKDGTLVEDVPFDADPGRVRLLPGAAEGVARLHRAGFRIFVVSNQPGVAQGRFDADALDAVRRRLEELLAPGALTGFYYCPHAPGGASPSSARGCSCRKPRPGMILRACREHGIRPASSWTLGDILDDVEAGRRAGCRTVLIHNGHETEWRRAPEREPHLVAPDVAAAARLILGDGE